MVLLTFSASNSREHNQSRIHCFDNTLQFVNVFSHPRRGKSPRRSLRPSASAVCPSNRFEIRIGAGRLIRNMRWTRARSRALASNYGPANQGSGRPQRARAGAGRAHQEHGALLRPIGRADAVRRIVAGAPLGPHRLPRRSRRSRSTHGSNASGAAVTDSAPDCRRAGDGLTSSWRAPARRNSVRTSQTQHCRGSRAVSDPRIAPTTTGETYLQLLHRSISLLRCGFTPVYALLGRFLPRLKAASGRPPFWR
jgi:hypothetical protein